MPDPRQGVSAQDLSKYRLEKAEQLLNTAKLTMEMGDYSSAANRAYYSIFNAMRAVLALEGIDFKRHSGVSSHFRKTYIKTGVFDAELSDIIALAFELRTHSDYNDFYVVSKEAIQIQLDNAAIFLDAIKAYLITQYS